MENNNKIELGIKNKPENSIVELCVDNLLINNPEKLTAELNSV